MIRRLNSSFIPSSFLASTSSATRRFFSQQQKSPAPHESFIAQQVSDRFFDAQKGEILSDLAENKNDKSLAGKVDERILEMVNMINLKTDFVTTSSCSGRISLFHRSDGTLHASSSAAADSSDAHQTQQQQPQADHDQAISPAMKRGSGQGTLYSTHDPLPLDCTGAMNQIWNCLDVAAEKFSTSCPHGKVELKFEPLILHVRCRDLTSAQKLIDAAVSCGLRKTGMIAPAVRLPMKAEERDLLKTLSLTTKHDAEEVEVDAQGSGVSDKNRKKHSSSASSTAVPNYIMGHNFLVSVGSMSGVNNIICLNGEMMISRENLHTMLRYFNEALLMGENEKRKKMLFEKILKL